MFFFWGGGTSHVTWSALHASSQAHPTGEYGGNLSDIPHNQSQHATDNLLANELCGRGEDVFGDGVSLHRR